MPRTKTKPAFRPMSVGRKLSLQRTIKREIAKQTIDEIKYYTIGTPAVTPNSLVANTLGLSIISGCAQGTGESDRVGMKVDPKYVQVKWSLFQNSAAVNALCRVMIFIDTQNNGTAPTTAEVLESAQVSTFVKGNNKLRFKMLYDKYLQVAGNNGWDTSDEVYIDVGKALAKIYKNPRDRQISYLGTAAQTSASNGKNTIYLGVMSDATVTANLGSGTARAGFDYSARMAFVDP